MDMVFLVAIKRKGYLYSDKTLNMKITIFTICLFLSYSSLSQILFVLSGTVRDIESGEQLIGANITVSDGKTGTQSNGYGFYSLSIKENLAKISCSYVGYQTYTETFFIQKDTTINIFLKSQDTLKSLEVIADKDKNIRNIQTNNLSIPIKQLANVPTLVGEKDLLKSLQLLPGIQFGQEGTSGLLVRGGSPDQNLILLDDVPMYNVSHLYGYFSIFSTDAIKSVDVYKGGFPARHGGRLSSVVDIRTKDGNMTKWQGNIGLGVLSINGYVEGPIIKNRLSIFFSARRSILDLWTSIATQSAKINESSNSWGYYFYDVNFKSNFIINDKNKVYLSVYKGRDDNSIQSLVNKKNDTTTVNQESLNSSGWGNLLLSLKWNKIFNNSFFSNYTAAFTNYKYSTGSSFNSTIKNDLGEKINKSVYDYQSSIKDFLLKQDFEYFFKNENTLRFGASQSYKIFKPGVQISSVRQDKSLDTLLTNPDIRTFNFAAYAQNEFQFSEKLKLNLGLRYDFFSVKDFANHYLQPRASVLYLINENTSLKSSFSSVVQDLHLLTNSTSGLPTDLWLPATKNVQPEKSSQITLGLFKNFTKKNWETSIEAYYKTLQGVIEYKEGASFLNSFTSWDDKVETGQGESYGLELFIHKKEGKVNGWISYTLSYNNRKFANLNQGNEFPFRFDRRHYLNIFINKTIKEGKRSISAAFVLATGNPVSIPTEKYDAANNVVSKNYIFTNFYDQEAFLFSSQNFNYPERNNFRMRTYSRLDVSYNYIKQKKNYIRTFSIGVYNLLFYRNPYYLSINDKNKYWIYNPGTKREISISEVSLFNFIPAVSLNYKFK
jgi:hypothetical protein